MVQNRLPISKTIIILPLVFIFIFTIMGYFSVLFYLEPAGDKMQETELIRLARSGAQMMAYLDEYSTMAEFDRLADLYAENNGFRATIIGLTGAVLGDSKLDLSQIRKLDDHSLRPEIVEARETGAGIARRHSNTIDALLLYAAVPYNTTGGKGFFRVAISTESMAQMHKKARTAIGLFCLIALSIAVLLGMFASNYLLKMVKQGRRELERRVQERTREVEILQNISAQLTACNTHQEALEVIKVGTSKLLPRHMGMLALFKASRDQLEIVEIWNGAWEGDPSYTPDQCWALRTGNTPYIRSGQRHRCLRPWAF